jgi:hypothetical protein
MTHFHVAAMVVVNTADGQTFTSRQVAIDYPTATAAAEVLVGLLERQQGALPASIRSSLVESHAERPGMSTDPLTADSSGEHYTVLECDAAGSACMETADAWMQRKIRMRKALGM